MTGLAEALDRGDAAPARLRTLLDGELARGEGELAKPRSGYGGHPVVAAFGITHDGALVAALPVPAAFRADASLVTDRAWRVVAAAVTALQEATGLPLPGTASDLALKAGTLNDRLALTVEREADPELAGLAFDEAIEHVDRLRARALVLPPGVAEPDDLKPPIGPTHPLRVAEALARVGGDPSAPDQETEDLVLALLQPKGEVARPHEDPDPARRVARRILQRLDGMGKWGGYHTDFAHLARGFAGNDRALADHVGEALIEAGMLAEKPSVGQRHVFLNPRRAGEIRRLIEDGDVPVTLRLPTR